MSSLLDSYVFDNAQVRIVLNEQGEPWFVARDVAEALEYSPASLEQPKNLMQNVPENWKGHKPIMTLGGSQDMLCLSEQGLYLFLGRSDKPKALPFQKWLAGEVLPAVRKNGGYGVALNMDEVRQLARLPEPYRRDAFRRMLALAAKHSDTSMAIRLTFNICLIFSSAETGGPLEQAWLTF